MTLSIVATAEPNNSTPRVRLTITDTGTPVLNSVTITRTTPDGNVGTVRTSDGDPLQLIGTTTRSAVLFDYEAPFGVSVVYSAAEAPTVTASAMVDEDRVWLIHPHVPDRSVPVDFRSGSFADENLPVNAGVFRPLRRKNAVVISDGQRKSAESSFIVATETLEELAAIKALVDDASVLLLNVPPLSGLGIETVYVGVQDVKPARISDVGTATERSVTMPYVVADPPEGGQQPQWTWADVMAKYPTWSALMAAQSPWAGVIAPTS